MTHMSENNGVIPSATPQSFDKDSKQWLKIIRYHESGTIISFQQDSFFRATQIVNNNKVLKDVLGKYHRKYLLGHIQIEENNLIEKVKQAVIEIARKRKIKIKYENNIENLLRYLELEGYDIGVFISHAECYLQNEDGYKMFYQLERLLRAYKNLSIILFSTIDITNEKYGILVGRCSSLFTNIIVYPLYSLNDSLHFMKVNCRNWNLKINTKIKEEIFKNTGGYHWLTRHILRFLREHGNNINEALTDQFLLNKVEILWKRLTDKEQLIVKKYFMNRLNSDDKKTHEYNYLSKTKIFDINLFKKIIEKEVKTDKIHIINGELLFNGENISLKFSPKEFAIIKLLIENKGRLVEREKLAEKIWGAKWEDKYSDWAIDRLIYRLRNKMKKIGIDYKLLKTLKTRGIIFG